MKYFDEQTREKAAGRYRRLFVDGFKSHTTLAFLQYAAKNKIVIVCYPPHCTHALQGLDVVIFARVKTEWGELLKELQRKEIVVNKYNFLQWYAGVRDKAITAENCIAAFKVTGIRPWDPTVIAPGATKPSAAHSTESTGLFNLPPEWMDIRAAMRIDRLRRSRTPSSASVVSQGAEEHAISGLWNNEEAVEEDEDEKTNGPILNNIVAHLNRAVEGTAYSYIADQEEVSFTSHTPVPDVYVSPQHHRSPRHPQYYHQISPDLLNTSDDLRAHLHLAYARIAYLEGKVDNLETNLFVIHQYAVAAQQKLYWKENKPRRESEKLLASGKRALTDPEYIALREAEDHAKKTEEKLTLEFKRWNEQEKRDRKAANNKIDEDWKEYKRTWALEHGKRRPPLKKIAHNKRQSTPEMYWPIRKKRHVEGGQDVDEDGDSDGSDNED